MGIDPATSERRETNAITSRLVLLYVERQAGEQAVREVVRRAGMEDRLERLLDESHWFTYDEKIALFEAAVDVLDDPDAIRKIGDVAIEMNVGEGLKVALRALGSPRLVYQNVVRANAKFTGSHSMELLELDRDRATIRYQDVTDRRRYDRLDCDYNRGLLACIPSLFGGPAAEIAHSECGCEGGDACVYEISWVSGPNDLRFGLLSGTGAVAIVAASALVAPALLPAAGIAGGAVVAWSGWRVARRYRSQLARLDFELAEQGRVSERLATTLQELASDLRLDEVLAKVTHRAQEALPGKEFALLLDEGGALRCEDATGIPPGTLRCIERFAASGGFAEDETLTIDEVSAVDGLAELAEDGSGPFRSLCAVPLDFREQRFGTLVALAPGAKSFLPRDLDVIAAYAAQAAIAIANGRAYNALENLASRDHLTGLLNHREFHETMAAELARCRRYGGRFSTLLFDLDHFKRVNDAEGHAAGDRVLSRVGEALAAVCRDSDLAFRVGGDEFALLLPNTDGEVAEAVAERARRAIGSLRPGLGASYGITVWPADAETKDSLLESADARLYGMKRNGAVRS